MTENKYKADVEALFDESDGGRKDSAKEIQSDGGGKEKKDRKKHLTQGQRTGILFMSWGLFIIAIGIIDYVDFKKTQRVKKQVEAFEKTLPPEYLEYKQAVEHYRDSLMHAKGR